MTQPPNQNPYGQDPAGEDGENGQRNQGNQNSPFQPYPSTPHPEDQPQGGYPGPGQGSGQLPGYQGYGAYPQQGQNQYGQQGYEQQGYNQYGQPNQYGGPGGPGLVRGDGRVNIMMAVRFAFKATFANGLIWLLGTLLFLFAIFALSMGVTFLAIDPSSPTGMNPLMMDVSNFLISAVAVVLSVFIYTGALSQVNKPKIQLSDFWTKLHFWPTLGVVILVALIGGVVGGVISFLLMGPLMSDPTTVTPEQVMSMFGALAVVILVVLLISPLTSYMAWYAADGREGVFGAVRAGFRDGARNYLRLLAFMVVASILMTVAIMITLGLAMIILVPAYLLAMAHIYRQMAGEPHPVY